MFRDVCYFPFYIHIKNINMYLIVFAKKYKLYYILIYVSFQMKAKKGIS